jgi:two-component system, OmpR family, sensor histidine kinase MtrB
MSVDMASILPDALRRTRTAVSGWTHRLGLRRRLLLSFAAGSLVLCSVAAAAAWWLSAGYLQNLRTRVATAEGLTSARAVHQGLTAADSLPALLERTRPPSGEALLRRDGEWFASALSLTPTDVPPSVRDAALAGQAVRQRADVDGDPHLFVTVPVDDGRGGGAYVAVLPLVELDATLRTLSGVLAGVALLTSGAFTVLGGWASRRALRPVERVSEAAAAVAAGDLQARLHTQDPDLRSLAETFNANAAALQARVDRDARFAADVSHELRSPLTTLVNAIDVMAARRDEMSPTAAAMLDLVHAELVRFGGIVRDLLEISVEDAAAPSGLEPVRISRLVRAAVGDDVPVRTTPGAQDAVVLGDPRRLVRVVCNLVGNADTHGGGVAEVVVRDVEDGVEIVVDDAGPGVPPHLRTEVFERFHRGPHARTTAEGAGLGLALVAQHVRRHAGHVRVEDRPGGGARFVVTLPRQAS